MRWAGVDGKVGQAVEAQTRRVLETYAVEPGRVEEDANVERSAAEGAYAKRQVFELLQNAADALRDKPGRCEVLLTRSCLYVANEGEPLSPSGVETLMAAHRSGKRDEQIGRFGLGFKSVLAVTDSPRLFSRSGSLVFDREASADMIGRVVPGLPHYPVTRVARAVDPREMAAADAQLAELMKWATTVVCLPLKTGHDIISRSMGNFPAQFVLFSPQVTSLDLDDRENNRSRRVTLTTNDADEYELTDSNRRSRWVVVHRRHHPSRAAQIDGGYQASRESVDMQWAVPLEGAIRGVGSFWAYFPTDDLTTLSGIVNAPWKLADDRASLLGGAFNDELLTTVLPSLVVEALPLLSPIDKPGVVIDVLPARGKESRSPADDLINDPIMRTVADAASIPTMAGTLARPARVSLQPDGLDADDLALWAQACPDPQNWVHVDVAAQRERRPKVARLMAYKDRTAEDLRDWIEHLVKTSPEDRLVEASGVAVRLVAQLAAKYPQRRSELLSARVLLLEDGTFHVCRAGGVFVRGSDSESGRLFIDSVLASDRDVSTALKALGIEVLNTAGLLRAELSASPIEWDKVWLSSRAMAVPEAESLFRELLGDDLLEVMRVRTYARSLRRASEVYLPGSIVPGDGSRDQDRLVDPRFHRDDLDLLGRLGLVSEPQVSNDPPSEPWRVAAEARLRDQYRSQRQLPRLPDESIEIVPRSVPWPVEALADMSDSGRVALFDRLRTLLSGDEEWQVGRRGGGDRLKAPHPIWDFVRRHGVLVTQAGLQPVARCLAYDEDAATIEGVEQPLPYVSPVISEQITGMLRLKDDIDVLSAGDWAALYDDAGGWEQDRRTLLYAWAAYADQRPPARVKVSRGRGHVEVPADQVAVATSDEIFESLVTADIPVVRVSPVDAEPLVEAWGMHRGEQLLVETLEAVKTGEPTALIDVYPPLRNKLEAEQHDLLLQRCSTLELRTSTPNGQRSRPIPWRLDGRTLLTCATRDDDTLRQIGEALELRLSPPTILKQIEEGRRNKLRERIAETEDIREKLVLAIGADELRGGVPAAAVEALRVELGRELDDVELADLALAVDGYAVLQEHRRVLEKRGLEPPLSWAGQGPARTWVKRLDFPVEFAGFTGERRPTEMEVEGPPVIQPLHDYQQVIGDRIKGLLDPEGELRRGLVPLPTGAGKTRVAVQALIEHMVQSTQSVRIVWVAETEELCEQAVQTWSYLWRALGDGQRSLTISRLWSSGAATERDGLQVVVASVDKLRALLTDDESTWREGYEWLTHPAMIVVDEAHRSISTEYTRTLSRLGGTGSVATMTTPLLGLTATPFRGFDQRGTENLIKRYHGHRLDAGVFADDDAYAELQRERVLARVRHVVLEGSEIELAPKDLEILQSLRRLPDKAERELGNDDVRNGRILSSLRSLPPDASVLVFAASVDNARVLAALLSFHGIQARAISGETDRFARRRYVDDFRAGRIRVLTNYSVFTEGFDVPGVDAVYVTRPTFSPNVYQQMIGRGLRGPLNGGKEEVLIVNVADNIVSYGEDLAFRHFDHLWAQGG